MAWRYVVISYRVGLLERGLEFALLMQRLQIVAPADILPADEDVWHLRVRNRIRVSPCPSPVRDVCVGQASLEPPLDPCLPCSCP